MDADPSTLDKPQPETMRPAGPPASTAAQGAQIRVAVQRSPQDPELLLARRLRDGYPAPAGTVEAILTLVTPPTQARSPSSPTLPSMPARRPSSPSIAPPRAPSIPAIPLQANSLPPPNVRPAAPNLPLSRQDYRELADFLQTQLVETTTATETMDLATRLARIHEILGDSSDAADTAEAFDLTVTRHPDPGGPESASMLDRLELRAMHDPGDDEVREHYIQLATDEGVFARAASTLATAVNDSGSNGASVRERVWFDVGKLYVRDGELPKARKAFLESVRAHAGGPSGLSAARRLLELQVDPIDPAIVTAALEVIVKIETEPVARYQAARKLADLYTQSKDWVKLPTILPILIRGGGDSARPTPPKEEPDPASRTS